jgi:hypothetical protein
MSLLIAFQLAAVFAVSIILVSALKDRTVYYSAVEDELSQNGIVIMATNPEAEVFKSEETVLKTFKKATSVSGVKSAIIFNEDYKDTMVMNFYDDETFENVPLYLDSGRLPKTSDYDIPECLVCGSFGFKAGDIFTFTDVDGNEHQFRISGILSDNQSILGSWGYGIDQEFHQDFRDLYFPLVSSLRSCPIFIAPTAAAEGDGLVGTYSHEELFVLNYPEDSYSMDTLYELTGTYEFQLFGTTEKYRQASEIYVKEQLYTLLPIAICILIITAFTAVTTTVISTMRNLRNYAVLYLCGATWRHCSRISLMNFLTISVGTAVLDILFFAIGSRTYLKGTVIRVQYENILVCVGILLIFAILSAAVPLLVVRKKQPRDVLKVNA